MPFARPDLATLIDRAVADIETRLPGTDARLRRSNLNVLARVHSGATHGLYGYLDWLARQLFPDTAESDNLDRWATIWGVGRKAAAYASGTIRFTGTDDTVIPAGSQLSRADGTLFEVDADATIDAGVADAMVTAVDGGADANTDADTSLTLTSPIAGAAASATVQADGIAGGADIESDDELRARLLARIQQPPQGGAKSDYVAWALAVPGVTRAWVYPAELGLGTVTVRFVTDDDPDGMIPSAQAVTDVQTAIDAVRPVTADVTVVAPVADALDFTISSLSPNTQAVKDAVEASLKDLLRREAEPGGTILISHIREAISLATDENDHVLVSPTEDVTHDTGKIATFGAITWE